MKMATTLHYVMLLACCSLTRSTSVAPDVSFHEIVYGTASASSSDAFTSMFHTGLGNTLASLLKHHGDEGHAASLRRLAAEPRHAFSSFIEERHLEGVKAKSHHHVRAAAADIMHGALQHALATTGSTAT